jgi:hypothetical protein
MDLGTIICTNLDCHFALTNISGKSGILWGMFSFGIAVTVGGFLYEAIKAQELISSTVLHTNI